MTKEALDKGHEIYKEIECLSSVIEALERGQLRIGTENDFVCYWADRELTDLVKSYLILKKCSLECQFEKL